MQPKSRTAVFPAVLALALAPIVSAAADPASILIIRNAQIFDGRSDKLRAGSEVVVSGNLITAIRAAGSPIESGATTIDAGGRVLLPGLIDAHVHPAIPVSFAQIRDNDPGYLTARAAAEARAMLMRGFTTIRDMGGPVFGIRQAIDEGIIEGPRIFPSGALISQTSGHGDLRQRIDTPSRRWSGQSDPLETQGYALIADGPDEVAAAVREQLRLGATQIKLMAGGGISSIYDPIDSVQYFESELRAAVQAAADWGTYVTVHAYTPAAIRRAVEAGVRSVEHGHLIDEPTMKLIAERGVVLSPQAYLFSGIFNTPPVPGAPPLTPTQIAQREKSAMVASGLDRMMQLARQYDVKIAFGTDVFGAPRVFALQSREFGARLRWFTPLEILRQATSINGGLLALSGPRNTYGRVGVIEPGALADLLIVDGNPLEDIRVLEEPQKNLRIIVKDGRVVKNTL